MLFYAFTGLFRPTHYVSSVLGLSKITPLVSALTMALGASQLCLASRILGGDEKQAAATGVSFFGGWCAARSPLAHRILLLVGNLLDTYHPRTELLGCPPTHSRPAPSLWLAGRP
jgi:hypothetical protein